MDDTIKHGVEVINMAGDESFERVQAGLAAMSGVPVCPIARPKVPRRRAEIDRRAPGSNDRTCSVRVGLTEDCRPGRGL